MRKRTKKKIFWGKIRDRISSVVGKINWQYIAIIVIIIIGVCVLIASYFICNNDANRNWNRNSYICISYNVS